MAKEVSDYTQLIPPPPEDLVEEFKQYMSNIAQNYNT